jgi:hypothetical protein
MSGIEDKASSVSDWGHSDRERASERWTPDAVHRRSRRSRLFAGLVLGWGCAGVVIGNIGQPEVAIAGTLLALFLPGWLTAEAALGGSAAELDYRILVTIGASLVITILIGAITAATATLTRDTLGWCWIVAMSIAGMGGVLLDRGAAAPSGPSAKSPESQGPDEAQETL